ncbi:molybdopterin-guanine dinucleotide biosynthesis protein B [Plasticicumulans acidivorans]|uniref:Molybdopterin-guanine dinucleotide biosynthesis protein B n=1 Tax=Plasticicumulans acidivorans TaxID=886464 RepID=A0A317MT52_9GAMM|nr:molybdopterin-guanine dinucleotide biosynthesis protein B [Plasticicumulans acidivorans]PWV60597.1 molybdopterin-guanine dinucleotide biosynthesis protein B [Plasticicumulans acidivorans]
MSVRPVFPRPLLGVVGTSGSGKTTLLCALIEQLTARGLRVGVVKQASPRFDVDVPGHDSDRLRRAGIQRLLLSGESGSTLIEEYPQPHESALAEALSWLEPATLDLVLVEGYAEAAIAKLEVLRAGQPMRHRHRDDADVIAVVCDHRIEPPPQVPCLDLNANEAVLAFVLDFLQCLPCRTE